MKYTHIKLHHTVETHGSFTDEELASLGEQLFKMNVRGHGDYADDFVWIQGRFVMQGGDIVFYTRNARGSSEMVGEENIGLRAVSYMQFLD